ncbi:phosphoglycerol geranylgeranyltransferase [Alkalitalea saponilacus]|uniref:Geranylgeranylglyceryl phosphate synthase n=1 Tax=Alkalitalea saponilacus TaxID=889453 RepID=A0A1T5AT92_9BACT|nr:geranylgeranylglyceryl/heptaprenylglyceryl phosphate synthase [Alkalitalea saponilacus]ASB48605.1 geranylgeranylglyceryl/heptaprenylglyceryl phosphate synthase [Alkalitalea saponilacus]SKB38077.1 putative glycerol-1-phosphate prenyltransferase [Alkalitalea saponilacus]
MIFDFITDRFRRKQKILAFLVDPDKCHGEKLEQFVASMKQQSPQLLLVGGSLISNPIEPLVDYLKTELDMPVVLYPGSPTHLTFNVDAVLFLSMISGRNAELLIGNQVVSAPFIHRHKIEPISTGYMLIDGGNYTSVEYMSQTRPIPAEKNDIAIATAMAGEMLGMKLIYMDAGSGAKRPVSPSMISDVKRHLNIPLMVGGGIVTPAIMKSATDAGADLIVVGNALEKDPELVKAFLDAIDC